MSRLRLSDIKISKSFANTVPKEKKMEECRKVWREQHRQDRYIVVNKDNVLVDGYIQYLVLKDAGIEDIEYRISDVKRKCWKRKAFNEDATYRNEPTTYVYGVHFHPNSGTFSKEYVWRIPKTWAELGWEDDLNIGDEIRVYSGKWITTAIVTRIERLDKCPVDTPVKRVIRKIE